MEVLSIDGLSKSYGPIKAVQSLALTVNSGEIMGLLGPNGSGKTTTLSMLLGIVWPDQGSYSWFQSGKGHHQRLKIGALLETPNFYPYLNAIENLKIIARIKGKGKQDIPRLLELVGLHNRSTYNFRTYSLGMKQRLAIAGALVGDPEVLILDEPANGLDPQGIAEVRETIAKIAAEGKTILMASHILDEVEKVCSHVAILKHGRLLANGPVGSLLGDVKLIELGAQNMDALKDFLATLPAVKIIQQKKQFLEIQIDNSMSGSQINQIAHSKGIMLNHLVVKKRSLESEFLQITK